MGGNISELGGWGGRSSTLPQNNLEDSVSDRLSEEMNKCSSNYTVPNAHTFHKSYYPNSPRS